MNALNVDSKIIERFKRLISFKRMGHAYLFVGPKEVGKTQTALALAQLVNCDNERQAPCQECPSCKKIASLSHPDVMIVGPQGDSIKIDQIRFVLSRLQLKAFEAKMKVLIMQDVELMTLEAANSLLKTLEEPPAHTLMILTTSLEQANLDTIRSRCHVVKFFASSKARLQQVLECSSDQAQFLTIYTDGCLGQARQLLDDNYLTHKNQLLDNFINQALDSKKGALDKEEAASMLQVFLSILRDAVLLKTGVAADELMNIDRLDDIKQLAVRPFEELSALYEQILRTRQLLDENLNTKMAFNILRQRLWVS